MSDRKVILMILDGWGFAKDQSVSAVDLANTPFIDSLYTKYPNASLQASGLAVGLPEGQMGNSEVGHMNLGAGRVVYQNLVKIGMALDNGSLAKDPTLLDAFAYARENNKKVHFTGLVSDGGVHSHINHLKGLLKIAADQQLQKVYIHAFTDGRDCDPMSGKAFIADLLATAAQSTGELASITGRYYAMDRDRRWDRIEVAYNAMVHGTGTLTDNALNAMQDSYDQGITDEFLKPLILIDPTTKQSKALIETGDVVICFNFRTDRGREITMALSQENFLHPDRYTQDADYPSQMTKLDLYFVTMTRYDDTFSNMKVIFDGSKLTHTLGEVLADAGKNQIRIAETEKYPHVTFFFSGGRETEFDGEKRLLCSSPRDVATYDLKPEMAAYDIRDAIIPELEKKQVDFVCLNFANPDMVGHTGIMRAAIEACEVVDKCAQAVTETALANGYTTIIIADHGNADCMLNKDGSPNTAHTTQPVPFILVDDHLKTNLKSGNLGDIAPTILALLGVDQPPEMTGKSLL